MAGSGRSPAREHAPLRGRARSMFTSPRQGGSRGWRIFSASAWGRSGSVAIGSGVWSIALIAVVLLAPMTGCGTPPRRDAPPISTSQLTTADLRGMAAEAAEQLKKWGGFRRTGRDLAQVGWEPFDNRTGQRNVANMFEGYLAPMLQSEIRLLGAYGLSPESKKAQRWVMWDLRNESGTHVPESFKPDFFLRTVLIATPYPSGTRERVEYYLDVDVTDAKSGQKYELHPITRWKP
jgi:hypothetical protein